MKTTEQKNRLITEFMGLESFKDSLASLHNGKINISSNIYEQAKYHTSWDWLMPVAHKCMQNETIDHLHPYAFAEVCNTITRALSTCQIHFVYDAVVKTIEFINQSKTNSHD